MWRFLKNLKIELPCDPETLHRGTYPEKEKAPIGKDSRTLMFTAELCTTANIVKQLIHPSTGECIRKTRYKYRLDYYSAVKTNEILPLAASWMDLREYYG